MSVVEDILDLARWAPSGDNTQPWRFEVVDELHVVVHGFDTRDHCVYDLDGHASQISLGALLETMTIAASGCGLRVIAQRRRHTADAQPTIDIEFLRDISVAPDPLIGSIAKRSVQRRPMRVRSLTTRELEVLDCSVRHAGYHIVWFEDFRSRSRVTRLLFRYAKLRLSMPEAYLVHRDIIEWNARYSKDRVPDQALGMDAVTLGLMHFAMRSWSRVKFFNTFLAGTWLPRIQMELLPGLACAAHFLIVCNKLPVAIDDYIDAGRAVQRFWLTATNLGLVMQPELTPLIFSRYVQNGIQFSTDSGALALAHELSVELNALAVPAASVFMGRVGAGPTARARSTRRNLDDLMLARE